MSRKVLIDDISGDDRDKMMDELKIKIEPSSFVFNAQPTYVYPFEVTDDYIYIPFAYARKYPQFPRPERNEFSKRSVGFVGELREEQKVVRKESISHMNKYGSSIISCRCGFGKCLSFNTPVMMYDGHIKPVQNIQPGEQVMGDDSTARNVLSICRGREKMYNICPKKWDMYTVNESHILSLVFTLHRKILTERNYYVVIYFDKVNHDIQKFKFKYYEDAIDFVRDIKEDNKVDISVADFLKMKYTVQVLFNCYKVPVTFPPKFVPNRPYIIGYNAKDSIPHDYKCNSRDMQLKVLAGILDKRGFIQNHTYGMAIYKELLEDVLFLTRSLGFEVIYKKYNNSIFRVYIKGKLTSIPVRTKILNLKEQEEDVYDTIPDLESSFKITQNEDVNKYYGFMLDENHRFLLGDFSVTHNTITSINIATKIKMKAMVIVNRIVLIKQWKESIKRFCPDAKVQVLTSKSKVKEDTDFYIMNAENVPKLTREVLSDIGLMIVDECLPGNTPIITSNGYDTIENICNKVEKGITVKVKTYNEQLKYFEDKEVVRGRRIVRDKNMVTLKFSSSRRKTRSTDNHKYLTTKGYVEAGYIKPGDLIIAYTNKYDNTDISRALNSDQIQIILGSFLGDGHINILRSGRYRLIETHCKQQMEYCNWKASMFGVNIRKIEKNGYAKKTAYIFTTKFFDFPNDFPKNKDHCPQWIIDNIDERALAIWYMDDGTFSKKGNYIKIFTNSFSDDSVNRLILRLKDFGIETKLVRDKGSPVIHFNNKNSNLFLKLIAPYLHKSMEYKFICENYYKYNEDQKKNINEVFNNKNYIPKNKLKEGLVYKVRYYKSKIVNFKFLECKKCNKLTFHTFRKDSQKWRCSHPKNSISVPSWNIENFCVYNWNSKFQDFGLLKVKEVVIETNPKEKYVFDIEVKDNHNFIIGTKTGSNGPVVHNCHVIMTESLSRCMNMVVPRYVLGLSATPYREDGMDALINLYFGTKRIERKLYREHTVYKIDTGFTPTVELAKNGRVNWGVVLDSQAMNVERNELIIRFVKYFPERVFLILCKRVDQGNYLVKRMEEEKIDVTSLIGAQQEYEKTSQVLVGTTGKCSFGFDHKRLDTLILASDIVSYYIQALGRVFRTQDGVPMILDLVDKNRILDRHWKTRKAVYFECGGKIRDFKRDYPDFQL